MRVLAAMSGGVDSAVAAALAVEAGHEVVGVHMALSRDRQQMREGSRGCCSIEDASDARRAADIIGIPYYVWDMSEKFHDTVVEDFLSEYEAGRTPNPCVRCNEHIKFSALLDKAMALGFDAVVTGHYAIIDEDENGGLALRRSANEDKDQSYVLAVMGRDRLSRAIFPLGRYSSKDEVRAEASMRGLGVSNKPDSYDICFVADGDTKGFLRRHLGSRPGEVVDVDGNVVGEHDGSYAYTVGQRRGLALGRPAADGQPRYVLEIQPVNNRVVVGPVELLEIDEMIADDAMWLADGRDDGEWHTGRVQVRAHGARVPARYRAVDGGSGIEVHLDETATLRGVAAGQSLVVYEGDRVMAQGTVASSRRTPAVVGAGAAAHA